MTYQDQEDRDYELNAPYDYVHEAGYGLGDDQASLAAEMKACAEEWQAERDAFVGPRLPEKVYDNNEIPF